MTDATVLIVGAGPAGLSMAILLGRLGLDAIVVERRRGVNPHPRARSVNVRTAVAQIEAVTAALEGIEAIDRVETASRGEATAHLVAVPANGAGILPLVGEALRAGGLGVEEISAERGRLDEVVRALTVGE